jgi:hypothetical protein
MDPCLHDYSKYLNLKREKPKNLGMEHVGATVTRSQLIDILAAGCQPLAVCSYFIAAHGYMFYSLTTIPSLAHLHSIRY